VNEDNDALRAGDGNRDRVFAAGPQVWHHIGHGAIVARWQHEFGV